MRTTTALAIASLACLAGFAADRVPAATAQERPESAAPAANEESPHDALAREILAGHLRTIAEAGADEPAILRLDLELEDLLKRASKRPESERVAFLAAGLSPQRRLYAAFGMPDLAEFSRFLLGKVSYPNVDLHRDAFVGRDLSAEIRSAHSRIVAALKTPSSGSPTRKGPVYKVAFGYQLTTNAQMQGVDRQSGRHVVVLNRSALAKGRLWDAAILHETWHCMQPVDVPRTTLLERAVHEGVATCLTQQIDPSLDDPTVMLWSSKEWGRRREAPQGYRQGVRRGARQLKCRGSRPLDAPEQVAGERPRRTESLGVLRRPARLSRVAEIEPRRRRSGSARSNAGRGVERAR